MRSASAGPTVGLPLVHWLVQSNTSTQVPKPAYAATPPETAAGAGLAGATRRRGAAVTVGRGFGAVDGGGGASVVGGGGGTVVVVEVVVVVGSATAARSSGIVWTTWPHPWRASATSNTATTDQRTRPYMLLSYDA